MIDIGQCIVNARKSKGLKQFELARRAEMSPGQLSLVEKGRVCPSFNCVDRLACALDMTVADMVSGMVESAKRKPAKSVARSEGAPDYCPCRAVEPDADSAIEKILAAERERRAFAESRGLAAGCTFALNRARPKYEGAGALMAEELRADLGLGTVPLGDLRSVLEFRGVRVHCVRLPKMTGSVLLWSVADETPVVVLNSDNTPERNLYRLVYELASACLYVSLGKLPVDETLSQHRFLTDFTTAFLMPGVTVRGYVAATGLGPQDWTFDELLALKAHFGVSAESFALRLEELGLISPSLRLSFRDRLRAYYKAHPKSMEPQPKSDWFERKGK